MPIAINCTWCKRPYQTKPYKLKKNANNFCSLACRGHWQSEYARGENNNNGKPRTAVTCDNCGKELLIIEFSYRRHRKHFCNTTCMGEWQSKNRLGEASPSYKKVAVACCICGKEIKKQPNEVKKRRKDGRPVRFVCSPECRRQLRSQDTAGEQNHFWQGGQRKPFVWRGPNWLERAREARKRDNYTCQHCGITEKETKRAHAVHHIIPFDSFGYIKGQNHNYLQANHLDNLLTLCPSCHMRLEGQIRAATNS